MEFLPKFREYQLVPGREFEADWEEEWEEESEWEARLRRKNRARTLLICGAVTLGMVVLLASVTAVVIGVRLPDIAGTNRNTNTQLTVEGTTANLTESTDFGTTCNATDSANSTDCDGVYNYNTTLPSITTEPDGDT